ncbi:JmjC domain-containing protein [Haliangium sp.]|uniref:JmjC domain-containing protein n=1 Tax=Haliangium sp. TaxID=2663208 RepID=UPI003D0F6CDE
MTEGATTGADEHELDAEAVARVFEQAPHADDDGDEVFGDETQVELADLIAPLSVAAFGSDHLGRHAVHLPGPPERYAQLLSLDGLRDALHCIWTRHRHDWLVRVDDRSRGDATTSVRELAKIEYPDIAAALRAGATLSIDHLDLGSARLRALTRAIRDGLCWAGEVGLNAHLSTSGTGFTQHFDRVDTLTLQLAGRKRWSYEPRPSLPYPRRNGIVLDGEPTFLRGDEPAGWERLRPPTEQIEVTLSPGDALLVPAGCWHATRAEGCSLALTVLLHHAPLTPIVLGLIEPELDALAPWRAGPPARAHDGTPAVDAAVRDYVRARLRELRAVVDALAEDDLRLERALARATANHPNERRDGQQLMDVTPVDIELDTLLVRRERLRLLVPSDADAPLSLYANRHEVRLPREAQDLAQRLTTVQGAFAAGSACGWSSDGEYEWPSVRSLLARLCEIGVLAATNLRDDQA